MTQATARLEINGQAKEYEKNAMPVTVASLVESLGLDRNMVVAEVNGDLVKRADMDAHPLADGDRVELVRLVGGG